MKGKIYITYHFRRLKQPVSAYGTKPRQSSMQVEYITPFLAIVDEIRPIYEQL
jgi:hypothetical protein